MALTLSTQQFVFMWGLIVPHVRPAHNICTLKLHSDLLLHICFLWPVTHTHNYLYIAEAFMIMIITSLCNACHSCFPKTYFQWFIYFCCWAGMVDSGLLAIYGAWQVTVVELWFPWSYEYLHVLLHCSDSVLDHIQTDTVCGPTHYQYLPHSLRQKLMTEQVH